MHCHIVLLSELSGLCSITREVLVIESFGKVHQVKPSIADVRGKNLENYCERDRKRDATIPFDRKLCEYLRRDCVEHNRWKVVELLINAVGCDYDSNCHKTKKGHFYDTAVNLGFKRNLPLISSYFPQEKL
jgi:hypothetical protein